MSAPNLPLFKCECGKMLGLANMAAGEEFCCPFCDRRNRTSGNIASADRGRDGVAREVASTAETYVLVSGSLSKPPPGSDQPTPAGGASSFVRLEGDRIGGFRVTGVIGKGGMGTVFKAHDEALDREVAIKVLSKQLSDDPDTVQRFKQEACSAARVTHPNIVHIYTRGEEDGRSYFVMEYVPGRSLGQEVQEQGKIPVERAVDWIRESALALEAAHRSGIIHRDIKPSNILLDAAGTIRIADFGLAKVVKADMGLTKTGMVVGTPFYMAPEQGKGGIVDHRADIYALGVTLYHLVVGRVPFEGGTPLEVMLKHVSDPIPVPKDTAIDTRPDLRRVLEKMMAKDPKDRYTTYDELIAALDTLRPRRLSYAAPASRIVAAFIDIFLIGGIAIPLGVVSRVSVEGAFTSGGAPFLNLFELFVNSIRAMLLLILYLAYAQGRFGESVGKHLLNLCVVRLDGFPISFKTALTRTICAYFLVIPIALWGDLPVPRPLLLGLGAVGVVFTLGYGLAVLDPRRRALHDRLCGTVVVYKV